MEGGGRGVRGPERRHRDGRPGDMLQDSLHGVAEAVLPEAVRLSAPHGGRVRTSGVGRRSEAWRTLDHSRTNVHAAGQEVGGPLGGGREMGVPQPVSRRSGVGLGLGDRGTGQLHPVAVGHVSRIVELV